VQADVCPERDVGVGEGFLGGVHGNSHWVS
jgi:hypothetical protein